MQVCLRLKFMVTPKLSTAQALAISPPIKSWSWDQPGDAESCKRSSRHVREHTCRPCSWEENPKEISMVAGSILMGEPDWMTGSVLVDIQTPKACLGGPTSIEKRKVKVPFGPMNLTFWTQTSLWNPLWTCWICSMCTNVHSASRPAWFSIWLPPPSSRSLSRTEKSSKPDGLMGFQIWFLFPSINGVNQDAAATYRTQLTDDYKKPGDDKS